MKKLFSLLFVALLATSAWGKIVTIDFTQMYSENTKPTVVEVQGITLTFDKNGGTEPQYYTNGTALRIYKNNKMTVAAEEGYTITNIDFTFSQSMWQQSPSSADVGTVTNQGDWIGEANSITFTNNYESSTQIRIRKMEITVVGGESPEDKVADPVFNPNGGNYPIGTSHEVTVECATPKSNIYLFKVTENGEEYVDWFWPADNAGDETPTQGTFYVTESGTYGAIAYKGGMTESDTTLVTFNFYKPTCSKPTFTPGNGTTFLEGEMITVTINCATEGATITYTVNDDIFEGTAPVSVPIDMTATITAIASKEGYNNSEEATATYTMVTPVAEGPVFTLVSDLSDLAAGDKIIFVNSKQNGAARAMAGRNGNNNFASVDVVVDNGQIQTNQANIVTLEENGDFWNFKTPEGYLYAPGGGNYLRLETVVDSYGNANAAITIDAETDTTIIIFQGSGDQKYMRSNPNNGNTLFSCYAEGSSVKGPVYIYKTTEEIIEVVAPEISPASNTTFVGSQQVTITCATEGAEIYYSFDEENWTKYEAPFTITESCTVYAYAKLGDAQSTIVSAKYYKANAVQNINEALNLPEGDRDFVFNGEAIVTYQNGQNTWIKDATGYGLIRGTVPEMAQGTVIADGWTAYLNLYYGVPQFSNPKNVVASEDVVTVEPVEMTTVSNDDVNMYITMKNQTLTAAEANYTWLNADGLKFYNQFYKTEGLDIEDGKADDVVGIATIYQNEPEVYIISVTEVQAPVGLRGDVDDNQVVNITDVTALINYLLTKNAEGVNLQAADCDLSGAINISDVTALINFLLTKNWPATE